jgi:hypothetical protein
VSPGTFRVDNTTLWSPVMGCGSVQSRIPLVLVNITHADPGLTCV